MVYHRVTIATLMQASQQAIHCIGKALLTTCTYFRIKGLLIMYTWHLNQQFPRILIPHLHNKMRRNVNLHFVTRFILLKHCVAM